MIVIILQEDVGAGTAVAVYNPCPLLPTYIVPTCKQICYATFPSRFCQLPSTVDGVVKTEISVSSDIEVVDETIGTAFKDLVPITQINPANVNMRYKGWERTKKYLTLDADGKKAYGLIPVTMSTTDNNTFEICLGYDDDVVPDDYARAPLDGSTAADLQQQQQSGATRPATVIPTNASGFVRVNSLSECSTVSAPARTAEFTESSR